MFYKEFMDFSNDTFLMGRIIASKNGLAKFFIFL